MRHPHLYKSHLYMAAFVALFAQHADAAFIYTYQPHFNPNEYDIEQMPAYSSNSRPTGVSLTAGATTAYTSNGTPTGLAPSVAASNGYGYGTSSVIHHNSSVIEPVDSVIYHGSSEIVHTSSVIEPSSSRIIHSSNVIDHSSSNRTCPDVIVPTCQGDSVLVNGSVDWNGCYTAPYCQYVGSGYQRILRVH